MDAITFDSAGATLAAPAELSPADLARIYAETSRPALAATMAALPAFSPLPATWPIVAVTAATLAPLGTADFPWLVVVGGILVLSAIAKDILGDVAGDVAGKVGQVIAGVLADLANVVSQGFSFVSGTIATVMGSVIAALGNTVKAALGAVQGAVSGAVNTLQNGLAAMFYALTQVVGGITRQVAGSVNLLVSTVSAALGSLANTIVKGISSAASGVAKMLVAIPQAILTAASTAGGAVVSALLGIAGWIVADAGRIIADVTGWVKRNVADPLATIATGAARWALDGLAAVGNGDPEAVMGIAAGLVAAAIPFGMAAHLLGNAAEIAHPIKQMGFSMTARALVDLTSIGKISELTIGAGYMMALGHPMEYFLSRRIRWRIPAERDIFVGLTKRDISEADARLWLAYHGYSDARIQALIASSWREPRPFELRRLADSGQLPHAWLRTKLRRNMLQDEDAELIAQAIEHNMYASQRGALWSAAFALLKAGASSPDRFAGDVAPLGMPADQIALGVRAAALQRAADLVTFQTSTLLTATVDGQMTLDDFGAALTALGLEDERVNAELARARVRITGKLPSPGKGADTAALRRLQQEQTTLWVQRFRRGLVDEQQLYANLVAIGLGTDLARVTVDIEVARRTPLLPIRPDTSAADTLAATLKEIQKAYVDEFRAGIIGADELLADLVASGVDPDLAKAIVVDEQARAYVPPPTTPSPAEEATERAIIAQESAYLRDLFRAGYIDADTYEKGLVDAGVDETLAAIEVQREVLRAALAAAK